MVVGFVNKDSAVGLHRIMLPLLNMTGKDVLVTNQFAEEDFEKRKPEAVYYNRVVSDDVINLRGKYGYKIIVDVDDYWHLNKEHVLYYIYKDTGVAADIERHLREADAITTTHERLADKVYKLNKNVFICPNSIPKHEYFPIQPTDSEYARIFWQGSITHRDDLFLLQWALKGLNHSPEKDKSMMVIAGYEDHYIWHDMVNVYTNATKLKGCVLNSSKPTEYYNNYKFADICLVPLVKNEFNSCKSNLKFLEAAYSSKPVICSEVDPYLGLPVLYAKDKKDWLKHIKSLINDKDMRNALGKEARAHFDKHYNYESINETRKQAIFGR